MNHSPLPLSAGSMGADERSIPPRLISHNGRFYHYCVPPPHEDLSENDKVFVWKQRKHQLAEHPQHGSSESLESLKLSRPSGNPPVSVKPYRTRFGLSYQVLQEAGFYSDESAFDVNTTENSRRFLRVLRPKTVVVPYDLNGGFQAFQDHEAARTLDLAGDTRHWLHCFCRQNPQADLLSFSVVARRTPLKQLLGVPFASPWDFFELHVYRIGKTLFLFPRRVDNIGPDFDLRILARGFQFEHWLTTEDCRSPQTQFGQNFSSVLAAKLGRHHILMTAEMDAFDKSTQKYVELKLTVEQPRTKLARTKFPHYWTQCFLGGIETLWLGVRNSNGMLQSCRSLSVSDIQDFMSADPDEGLQCLNAIIDWLLKVVRQTTPYILMLEPPNSFSEGRLILRCDRGNIAKCPIETVHSIVKHF